MTHSDPTPSRKPRRRGLALPFVLAALVCIVWSVGWFWLRNEMVTRMDATAAHLKAEGYDLSWTRREVTGFPFRLDVRLENARVAEPSGWAVRAPKLKGEAMIYGVGHWMIVAPAGVVLTRPEKGDVVVTGEALRASLDGFDQYPPRISIEGAKLVFTTAADVEPFPISSTDALQLHLRAGPDDQAAILFKADGAKVAFTGLLGRIAQDRTASLYWDSRLSKASALRGDNWTDAVRDWTAAGGAISVESGKLTAGDALIEAKSGALTVDPNGRLRGALDVTVREKPSPAEAITDARSAAAAIAAAAGQDPTLSATLDFQNGRTRLGPFDTGPSPQVYVPR
ncbi:hypothetical protein DMC25_02780 [Caulobacter sp. D4A]|uniref:DUF2125 domain-containing protein n=1 Tax=unclassified Caulobacter TaxID=2648921 RepID=UPI000D72CCC3|nr:MULTISPECIES: DUF2125 domain-containing protein [unclassified Caulobacter]PXA87504.1 hypothetical protein DMC18_20865 [Caulobacter sp. D5]PXA94077.1 hypothetical protein DMC25_02780 [Caulobacter sp. D4A]